MIHRNDDASLADDGAPEVGKISEEHTMHFLQLGLVGPSRPIDALLEHLRGIGEASRFDELMQRSQQALTGSHERVKAILEGEASYDEIKALKADSVGAIRDHRDPTLHLAATATYYVAIAGALSGFRKKITRQPLSELATALLDLAATSSSPWSNLFEDAVEQLEE